MDAHNEGQAPATDDQDLASILAGVGQQSHDGLQFEETPAPAAPVADDAATTDDKTEAHADAAPEAAETPVEEPEIELPQLETILPNPVAATDTPASSTTSTASPELEGIKKDALSELRPLVDKLNLPADEKFDTLLLIIRSTDDQTLISEAHEAAKAIEDETRRAAALLDVIKEIDYFGSQSK